MTESAGTVFEAAAGWAPEPEVLLGWAGAEVVPAAVVAWEADGEATVTGWRGVIVLREVGDNLV